MSVTFVPDVHGPHADAPLEVLARAAHATDLFVFRKIAEDRFAHVDGFGRGVGWAGIVEVGLKDEPSLAAAAGRREVTRRNSPEAKHAFGPYYARSVAIVPIDDDLLVAFGSNAGLLETLTDDEFTALGSSVVRAVGEVSPAKRLADELELVNAVRDLLLTRASTLEEALDNVVTSAAAALSCEAGVLYLAEPERLAIADRGFALGTGENEVIRVMRELVAQGPFPVCIQDAAGRDLPTPFSAGDGIMSYYLLELEPPLSGALLMLHTRSAPRGFTSLCQTLGRRLVEAAGTVLSTGLAREALQEEADQAGQQARRDPLTGLVNRLGWEEGVASTEATGMRPVSIIQLDCRGLKETNNLHGHHVGDQLLRALADLLTENVPEPGIVARLGGDEFAVLLPGADESDCEDVVARITRAVAGHAPIGEIELKVSLGTATATDGDPDLASAHRRADAEMLRDKAASAA